MSIMKQNITEEILINEAHWISITREVFSYISQLSIYQYKQFETLRSVSNFENI